MRQCSGCKDFNVVISKARSLSRFDSNKLSAATQFRHAFPLITNGYERVKALISTQATLRWREGLGILNFGQMPKRTIRTSVGNARKGEG